ncbi:unnamed protein product [Linum tenue]|uniref:Uncharacterized protein n=1 Tax=Linum tenue TaxID=586396 RepID=A0AAV0HRA4_9ROSI|nr:unnamed protein product [Linum tenue]
MSSMGRVTSTPAGSDRFPIFVSLKETMIHYSSLRGRSKAFKYLNPGMYKVCMASITSKISSF